MISILLIIIGIFGVLKGADWLTDGACSIARRMNIPQIVIGLTIVAFGTSMPELSVSFVSALKHSTDLAVGNVVGSNIFNAMLIVGVSAIVAPITITKSTVRKDIPFAVLASILLLIFCIDGVISRIDSAILLIVFIFFMVYTLRLAKSGKAEESTNDEKKSYFTSTLFILGGLALLILGSNFFVKGAVDLAHRLGVSEAIIGLTIVAGGTSLPELATSIVSARKGQSAIAIGNVVGSNVFNILLILGVTGIIFPMPLGGITYIDLTMLIVSIGLVWTFSYTKYKIQRWEGILLTVIFLVYMVWLIASVH